VVCAIILAIAIWPNRTRIREAILPAAHPAERVSQSTTRPPDSATAEANSSASHLADDLNAPAKDIRSDLHVVADVLEAFRTNFPHDGNPVGSNAEITRALGGKNKLQLVLIPPNHPAINGDGELCDRWGTPFFFHAESGTRRGIRSAGPDGKMWTADDVVLEP
jgi:hypothetical protein